MPWVQLIMRPRHLVCRDFLWDRLKRPVIGCLGPLTRLDSRGAVAIMFALSIIPMLAIVGLSVDYSCYIQARSQLNLAADAAAMQAVRAASQAYSSGLTTVAQGQAAGVQAGQQWFAAQLGTMTTGTVLSSNVAVSVVYTQDPGGFKATVTFNGAVPTHFGKIFNIPSWNISNASNNASAVITNSYMEIVMLLDNSSSMLIGATISDIVALEQATMCSTQSATMGQGMSNYSWNYGSHNPAYGYDVGNTPPPAKTSGSCDAGYTGDPSACFYIPSVPASVSNINPATGTCLNGGGVGGTPQAPCAFACHNTTGSTDYYYLARHTNNPTTSNPIQLRLDVIHSAAANVIQSLQNAEQTPNQFSVGVYQFDTSLHNVYPSSASPEAGTDLTAAAAAVNALVPQPVSNGADTGFQTAATNLSSQLTGSGDGTTPTTPIKNLFIVTDGMEDATSYGNRILGQMTDPANETTCQQFKNKGYKVYVLYTPYLPLPNPWYFANVKPKSEPTATSTVILALQACASSSANFFQASDPASINSAMQKMLSAALNTPGRISQ